jgi:quercetin dioxygenase-like cupin family protein
MEREIERERDKEKEDAGRYSIEASQIRQKKERDQIKLLPRVIRPLLFGKDYALGTPRVEGQLTVAPLRAITCAFITLQPGESSAPVRGVPSGLFYILEGSGSSVQDGTAHKFEQGDLVVLPPYTHHQLVADAGSRVRVWVPQTRWWHLMGLLREEVDGFAELPPGAEPFTEGERQGFHIRAEVMGREQELTGYFGSDLQCQEVFVSRRKVVSIKVGRTKYDYMLQMLDRENEELRTLPRVLRSRDLCWEDTRFGRLKYYISYWTPVLAKGLDVYVQQLAPGGKSGKHRHFAEQLLLVTRGRGYDIHDGARHDWAEGDLIAVPPMTVHQHSNAADEEAELVSVSLQEPANHNSEGIEHMEDATAGHR